MESASSLTSWIAQREAGAPRSKEACANTADVGPAQARPLAKLTAPAATPADGGLWPRLGLEAYLVGLRLRQHAGRSLCTSC